MTAGDVVVRTLPGDNGHLAVFAAARLQASPRALVTWTRAIDELKRNPMVLAVRRFSEPPMLADLSALTLDGADLEAIRECQPGRCDVKLSADEIVALRTAIDDAGIEWRSALHHEYRRLLLARLNLYRREGIGALPAYADRSRGVRPRDALAALVIRSPYLTRALPDPAAALVDAGLPSSDEAESLFYWSKERYGTGKNVVSMTHVQILQAHGNPLTPKVLVIGKQLYSSHYSNGGLSLTAVVCDREPGACYLAYVNRSYLDVFGGFLGGLKRAMIERRIESDTPAVVRELRHRLESGDPVSGTPVAR